MFVNIQTSILQNNNINNNNNKDEIMKRPPIWDLILILSSHLNQDQDFHEKRC